MMPNEHLELHARLQAETLTPANGMWGNDQRSAQRLNRRGDHVLALVAMAFCGAIVGFVVGFLVGRWW